MPIDLYPSRVQPRDRAARVQDGLTADLRRSSDVGADDVVGARELGRHAHIVIGKAQAQRRDAEAVQQPAEPDVALGVGSSTAAAPPRRAGGRAADAIGEVARAHEVVRRRCGVSTALVNVRTPSTSA